MYYNNQNMFGITPAVKNLIIINVIFLLADKLLLKTRGIELSSYLALYNPVTNDFRPYQLVTSMFMHAGYTHLIFNMLGLFFFGRMLENVWGQKRFLTFYFICGIGSALIFLGWSIINYYRGIYDHNMDIADATSNYFAPCVGASGAVFGLMMGAAMLFPNTVFHIYGLIPIKLAWMAILYGTFELVMSMQNNPEDRVARFAHVGGLVFGLIMVLFYQRNKKNFY